MQKCSKRGAVSVFLSLILPAFMSLVLLFVYAAGEKAFESEADALSRLAGQSVLGEYDSMLFEKYGILAIRGGENRLEEKLDYYLSRNLGGKYTGSSVNFENFRLADNACKTMEDAFTSALPKNSKLRDGDVNFNVLPQELPSCGKGVSGPNILTLSANGTDILKHSADVVLYNGYVFSHFNRDEVLYVIYGKLDREKNRAAFKTGFVALRTILNTAFIESNARMRREVLAVAEMISPGAVGVAIQQALIAAWALAEAENDYKLLAEGENVAFVKTERTWALDSDVLTDSRAQNRTKGAAWHPASDEGLSEKEYLELFLAAINEKTKALRILDLIQMDFCVSYYEDFRIADYNIGFAYSVSAGGKNFNYEEKY